MKPEKPNKTVPRVLISEDSPTQAEKLRLILESEGFEVAAASNGREALERLNDSSFDIVISDIMMPGLTGYELCRAVKADPAKKNTPVVLLTTLSDHMDIIHGLECGADNFITKPYETEYLIGRVREILGNKRLRHAGKLSVGAEVVFRGKEFRINSDKEQILDLLISTFDGIVRTNQLLKAREAELAAAKAKIEDYARKLEGRVRVSEGKYEELMRHASDMIFVIEPATSLIEDANQTACKTLGYTREELLRMSVCGVSTAFPDQAAWRVQAEAIKAHGSMISEDSFRRSDKTTLPVEVNVKHIVQKNRDYLLAIVRDISERKKADQALQNIEAQFRQAQKMEAVGRLAGGVAHDFNNLLTAIMGYAELMLPSFGPEDERREDTQEIVKTADRAARLTRQLLAFSRRQVLEPVVLDLNAVLTETQSMLRRVIGEDVSLSIAPRAKSPRVKFDPTQIEQVLMNLVINARDAMPKGGGIIIETTDSDVNQEFAQAHPGLSPGGYVVLMTSDNGSGMDQETLAHIFEPFFTTKEKGKGTGLGLSTVYGIVKQSGGYIDVYSEPGMGTTFKIYLSRAVEEVAALLRPKVSKGPARGTETILLVEDEEGIRRLAERILGDAGYQVLAASNGKEALDRAAVYKQPIHLLLSDVVMPKLGGGAMAELLGRLHPETKILFMSGYTEDAVVQHGILPQGINFLRKPFPPSELTGKVRETLDAPAAGRVPTARGGAEEGFCAGHGDVSRR